MSRRLSGIVLVMADTKVPQLRFWVPLVIGMGVTPFALVIAEGYAGAGHGTYLPAVCLFPYAMLLAIQLQFISNPVILLAGLQFPVYGALLAYASERSGSRCCLVGCILLVLHCGVIAIIFATGLDGFR